MLLSWVQNFRNSVPQFATPGPQSGIPGQLLFSNNEKLVTLAMSVAPFYTQLTLIMDPLLKATF